MTREENIRRSQDEHVQYITEHLYNCKGSEDFVFISYKSDDWHVVLHKIVYALVKRGLHVYFDGSFDSHNSLWIRQFPKNMGASQCKGVLAFFDDKYVTSYATLLELMYSQSSFVTNENGLPVVPVNLSQFTVIEDDSDTGLGDGTVNTNAEEEEKLFARVFNNLKDNDKIKRTKELYVREDHEKFSKKICSKIAKELIGRLVVNENHYVEDNFDWYIDKLVDTIKDACGNDVFGMPPIPVSKITPVPKTIPVQKTAPVHDTSFVQPPAREADVSGRIALEDFLKKYNAKTFSKNTFGKIRLVGEGSCSSYRTDFYGSAYEMVWAFVREIVQERGEPYIQSVIQKNAGVRNPPFITVAEHQERKDRNESVKYRQLDLPGMDGYSMCRHFGQYDWIAGVLKRRLQELNLPLNEFWLEYDTEAGAPAVGHQPHTERVGSGQAKEPVPAAGPGQPGPVRQPVSTARNTAVSGSTITGPVNLKGGVGAPVEKMEGTMLLPEFLKKYNHKTFQSNSCKSIRLIGAGEYEAYSTDVHPTARSMVFAFAMKMLDKMGMEYIRLVNAQNTGKNPIFITEQEHQERKSRHESVSYKPVTSKAVQGYSMCTHYSEYDWLKNSLKKQLNALGWQLDRFRLEIGQ